METEEMRRWRREIVLVAKAGAARYQTHAVGANRKSRRKLV